MSHAAGRQGLTIIEVLIALAIVAVISTVLLTTVVTSFRTDRASGERTQAAQYLNYLGRRVAGGHRAALPTATDPATWGYGELDTAFPDLTTADGFADPNRFRARVALDGDISVPTASIVHYVIDVCWRGTDSESCLTGHTGGPPPTAPGTPPPLPGLN